VPIAEAPIEALIAEALIAEPIAEAQAIAAVQVQPIAQGLAEAATGWAIGASPVLPVPEAAAAAAARSEALPHGRAGVRPAVPAAGVPPVWVRGEAEAEAGGGGKTAITKENLMRSTFWTIIDKKIALAIVVAGLLTVPSILSQAPAQTKPAAPSPAQKMFATPEEAAKALIQAAGDYDVAALTELLGPDSKDLISSGDPIEDKNNAVAFAELAKEKFSVVTDPAKPGRAVLVAGKLDWPSPIPIVKKAGKWYFDTKAGREEILFRRIGENELDAIQVCRGFVAAQLEYASTIHDNSGIPQYAQRLISTPGKQDGLYWKNPDGTPGGPVTEGVAKAIEEGYSLAKGSAYHGYYFRLLMGQGPDARMGELDYVLKGLMIGGFAMVAVPAEYRVTGVQTFLVNHDGVVYQKDLGPDSLNIAKQMTRFNPDKTWHRTEDQWPDE
jgi:hypothetical protein